jgi:type II secretory pathway pseudopilin PulG
MKTKRTEMNRRRETAFTLVEVVVSLLALSVTLVSLYAAFSAGFGLIKSARENMRATQILVEKTEGVRLFTWSQLASPILFPRAFTNWYWPAGMTNGTGGGIIYRGFVDVSFSPASLPADYRNNMASVTITLYWTNSANGQIGQQFTRTRQMQTYVARYGMQDYNYIAP